MKHRKRPQPRKQTPASQAPSVPPPGWKKAPLGLLIVLIVAGALRLAHFGQSPPGLNQDEAINAWNAYCLLQTGTDQVGDPWPIFYSHAIGDNRTTLYYYALLPFQAIGGLNVVTTRLPSAIAGIIAAGLIYFVGNRLFGRPTGLVAGLLLALNPWHLQLSRWGIEGGLCPMLGIAPLALLIWANLPPGDDPSRRPRPIIAALAGLVAGVGCYGYWAMRLFTPALLIVLVVVTWRSWWACVKTRRGLVAVAAFVVLFAVTFGPLATKHMTDPAGIAKRREMTTIAEPGDSSAAVIGRIAGRYIGHFDPRFLFVHGDRYAINSPPRAGQFQWYMLPLMVGGLAVAASRWRSVAFRVLLACVLVYPVSDILARHRAGGVESMHAMRSSPGLCVLVLLAAVGAVVIGRWLYGRQRGVAFAVGGVAAVLVVVLSVRFLAYFYGGYNREPGIYHGFHVDLLQACRTFKPQIDQADAVFCTTQSMNQPFAITLVGLGYDPDRWFAEPRDVNTAGPWDLYLRYGKMHFMYGQAWLPAVRALQANGREDRVVFLVRPKEHAALSQIPGLRFPPPSRQILRPDGAPTLLLCELTL